MNLQQLEYILAVDKYRHFARAADACFVTQPTLSMMIQKLEEELAVKMFDRSKHPVTPTPIGHLVIVQARVALKGISRIKELVDEEREAFQGVFKLGIIPTVAPYFLPYFLPVFVGKYPQVQLVITEMVTSQVIANLSAGVIDAAILATPLNEPGLAEHPLYYERFFAYVSKQETVFLKNVLSMEDVAADRLWLLEEGHCFRSQIIHYCDLRNTQSLIPAKGFIYEAGSIETLIRLVDQHGGMTIIPEMASKYLRKEQAGQLKPFSEPAPVREISLVTREDFMRYRMVNAFREIAATSLPGDMTELARQENIVNIVN